MQKRYESFYHKGEKDRDRFLKDFQNKYKIKSYNLPTKEQDSKEHWDIELVDEKRSIKVDVKGLKKIGRYDDDYNEDLHWVETQGITGHPGWVCGKADYISFECFNYWLLVNRSQLEKFVFDEMKKGKLVTNKYHATDGDYYQRKDRSDIMTLIKKTDMLKLNHIKIPKV